MSSSNIAPAKKQTFSVAISTESYQNLIRNTLKDPKRANRFIASITSAVATTPALQTCEPSSILAGGLLGEALNLSPSPQLGQYYLVPFKQKAKYDREGHLLSPECFKAQFVLGYKGYVQLALRSGQYSDLDCMEIRQGEYLGKDPHTAKPQFKFIEDDDLREKLPIVGYMAYFEYLNGFRKCIYWSREKMLNHADTYSQAFSKDAYDKIQNGQIADKDMWKYSSFWYKDFDSMAKKTLLRQLISKWGIMTAEMTMAYERDGHVMMPDTASGDLLPEVTDTPELSQQDEQEQPKIERTAKTMDLPEPEADEVKAAVDLATL